LPNASDRFSNANVPGYAWMICNGTSITGVWEGGRATKPIAYTSATLAAGPHTLKIVLDTTGDGSSFTANFFIDDTSVTGGPKTVGAIAVQDLNYVGSTQYSSGLLTGSTVDDFTLSSRSARPGLPPNFPSGGIAQLPGGHISLTASGAVGATYKLWASTNVALTPIASMWTLLTNGTVGLSPFTIIDAAATNFPQRFYRFSAP
jgi:hypothetical protein